MEDTDPLQAARAIRRAVLGDDYVDGQTTDPDPGSPASQFQDYITSLAWGVWTRAGALTPLVRSLLVLAMTAALGRMEEFCLHAGSAPRAGVTDEELDELLFQVAAYCGAPAGNATRRGLQGVVRTRRARGRLHPHLPLRRGLVVPATAARTPVAAAPPAHRRRARG